MVQFKAFECMMKNSTCYKSTKRMTVKGILWHSTGANNPWLKRYVQPYEGDDGYAEKIAKIGKNTYGNDWNHITKQAGLNCWVGKFADGSVGTVQAMPWDFRPWGCGAGDLGSCNDGWIQFEICEDDLKDKDYAEKVWNEAVRLTAWLCEEFHLDPKGTVRFKGVDVPVILCHWDSYKLGLGSGHGDIYHWFPKILGKGMQEVRDEVEALLKKDPGKTGWSKEGDEWYYYRDGEMLVNSWVKYKGAYYYTGADGAMLTGWQDINGSRFYFRNNGEMASGEWIEGLWLDMDGVQRYSRRGEWKKDARGKWYQDSAGMYPRSKTIMVDGVACEFDKDGYLIG